MSRFGKIELSDPRYERDNLRFLTFQSPALKGRGDVALFVPPDSSNLEDIPLVVLLHGVYCSHWAWAWKGGVHITAAQMIAAGDIPPMVLAMPSDGLWAEGSGYLQHTSADYEAWIIDDVIDCVTATLPQLGQSSSLYIAGLSMGGYGALRLGAKYADLFHGISAHSSVTSLSRLADFVSQSLELNQTAEDVSIVHWLRMNHPALPAFRFDCGSEDKLIEDNRELHKQLNALQIPHQYQEFPGAHKWAYWADHVKDTLRFFSEIERNRANDK
ncbi:MAG: alpha/beta hydrolase-fold protein [Chloroflexota bacterium]